MASHKSYKSIYYLAKQLKYGKYIKPSTDIKNH